MNENNEMKRYKELEERLGYAFRKKEHLLLALTHSSFHGTKKRSTENYERMEFLGDSILEHIIANHLFHLLPEEFEGKLTKWKAAIVCESSLAKTSRRIGVGAFLRLGIGEDRSGGRERDSILADVFEAILAAIYLDGGFGEAERVALALLEDNIRESLNAEASTDYKTTLQEKIQVHGTNLLRYQQISEEGPPHDRRFGFELYLEDRLIGTGIGKTKKEAQQSAARAGLEKLESEGFKG